MIRWRCNVTRPYMEPHPMFDELERFKRDYRQEIAHIYDLLHNICTFQKIRFSEDAEWVQSSDGYYKLNIPSTNFVALAAFENIDGANDRRANCVIDSNKKYVTVTSPYPFDGYIVAADVDFDDDDTTVKKSNDVAVDRELCTNSLNPVTNRAITLAINSLMAQVSQLSFPASLPASDVYSWAKTKNKPCYTWDEICGKPDVVTEILINGKKFKNVGGTIVLDKIVDYIDIPKKLSDLELDASVFDLKDGEALKSTISGIIDNEDRMSELITAQGVRINNAINELQANDEELAHSLDTTNSRLAALTNKVTQNSIDTTKAIAKAVADCKEKCDAERDKLKKDLDDFKKESKEEDDLLHAQLSALAHECRLHHDMYDSKFASIAADITKLQSASAEALVGLIKTELASMEADVAKLTNRVKQLEDNQVTITKPEDTNGILTINGKNVVVYDDSVLEKYTQGIADDVDSIKDKVEIVEQAAEQALELEKKINENKEALEDTNKAIEQVEKELKNAAAASGLKVTKSETNGNITLLYPKKDEEGNVVYNEADEVVYDEENAEEIVVYEAPLLNKLMAEAEAIQKEKGEDAPIIPTKVSDLENDLNYITRKQAAGLVASATVNFDTAFEDDDIDNITYVKTVNISNSQGSVIVNGDDIIVNVDGIGEMQATIAEQAQKISDLEAEIKTLKDSIAAIPQEIDLTDIINRIQKLEISFKTFVDEDGVLSEDEQPLWEKQDQANAVTDEDALSIEEIEGLYNEV